MGPRRAWARRGPTDGNQDCPSFPDGVNPRDGETASSFDHLSSCPNHFLERSPPPCDCRMVCHDPNARKELSRGRGPALSGGTNAAHRVSRSRQKTRWRDWRTKSFSLSAIAGRGAVYRVGAGPDRLHRAPGQLRGAGEDLSEHRSKPAGSLLRNCPDRRALRFRLWRAGGERQWQRSGGAPRSGSPPGREQ